MRFAEVDVKSNTANEDAAGCYTSAYKRHINQQAKRVMIKLDQDMGSQDSISTFSHREIKLTNVNQDNQERESEVLINDEGLSCPNMERLCAMHAKYFIDDSIKTIEDL